ncbi:MAG: gliding motility lipoprotein GldH [Prolixibacteraceae bacterium]
MGLVLFACDTKRVFEDFYTTKSEGWNKDSVANFTVAITDTKVDYNLLINCRNLENYPYSNLWLFVDIISPDSMAVRDTLEYQLAYPNGKWTGRGTGGVYENQFTFRSKVFFPDTGNYQFIIQHGMRDETLKGLKDIGIRIEKTK